MIRSIYYGIIVFGIVISASLQGMEYAPPVETNETQELKRVTELLKNAISLRRIDKAINGYISGIHLLDGDKISVVERCGPKDKIATLHIYDMKEKRWAARSINDPEKTLAEFGFNVESMDEELQTKIVNLLKAENVFKSLVQPAIINNGYMVFAKDKSIIVIDPSKAEKISSFNLPSTTPEYKEIRLFSTTKNDDLIVCSINTTSSGGVHIFSLKGEHIFYEPTGNVDQKPTKVILGKDNTIAIGRKNNTRIYIYDKDTASRSHIMQPTPSQMWNGELLDWYDNKAFVLRNGILIMEPCQTESGPTLSYWLKYHQWALCLGNGFFSVPNHGDYFATLSPYLFWVQEIAFKLPTEVAPHHCDKDHSLLCRCCIGDNILLAHGTIKEVQLSGSGRMMFSLVDGQLIFFEPEPLKLLESPLNLEEFRFLTECSLTMSPIPNEWKHAYCLFKNIQEGKINHLGLNDLYDFFLIPERLRKKLIANIAITSPSGFHNMDLTKEEKVFLATKLSSDPFFDPEIIEIFRMTIRDLESYKEGRESEKYRSIPKRFRHIIESYYSEDSCSLL